MSWLRLDDGFTRHPKFAGWTVGQKWALLQLFEYCARYDTDGRVPTDLALLPRTVTPALLRRAESAGWLDRDKAGALIVHDWAHYSPPNQGIEQAVFDYLSAHPNASANEVVREVKGARKRILAAIRRFQSGSQSGSENDPSGSEVVIRAPAPARAHGPRPDLLGTNTDTEPEPEPEATHDRTPEPLGNRPTAPEPDTAANGAGAGAGDLAHITTHRPAPELDTLNPHATLEHLLAEGTA